MLSSRMTYGPFPTHLITRLREALEAEGGTYELIAKGDVFSIEVPNEFAPIVESKVSRESYCPKCGVEGSAGGRCPRHDVELLGFAEFVAWRRARARLKADALALPTGLVRGRRPGDLLF